MPLNNNFFGVYKSFNFGGKKVVASNVTRNRQMQTSPVNYVQGTPKARVLDISGVSESLSVDAPLFVGSGSSVDGRSICNQKIKEILGLENQIAVLPVLSEASFSIGAEQSSVSLTLESDGDPNNTQAFEIRSDEIPELDPVGYGPTRLAKFYDFRVQLGNRKFFITSANLQVSAQTEKKYFFIPGEWGDFRGWGKIYNDVPYGPAGQPNELTYQASTGTGSSTLVIDRGNNDISFQPGTQFPFLGVAGIQVKGSGSAAVLLEDIDDNGDFIGTNESINLSLEPGTTDMTLQDPGIVRTEAANFKIEIYDPRWAAEGGSGIGWSSLLPDLDLSKAVVHSSNFKLGTGIMTVDFNFSCWVK